MSIDLTSDFDVLVATIDGEAEGIDLTGKQAVASSIMNRVKQANVHPHFGGGTIRGACLSHAQYSCWLPGPDCTRIMALNLDHPTPAQQDCIDIAKAAIAGTLVDPTSSATYYFAPSIPAPIWVAGAYFCGIFGGMLFWRGVK